MSGQWGRPGSALLVHTRSLPAWLIEEGTQGPWGHVAVCDGTGWVIEAWPGGVRAVPEGHYANYLTARIDVPLTDAQRAAAVQWLRAQEQQKTPYNWPAIAVFTLKTLRADVWLGPFYRRFATWAQNRKQTICSEFWVNMLQAVAYDTKPLFGADLTSEISPNRMGLVAATNALYYRLEAAA